MDSPIDQHGSRKPFDRHVSRWRQLGAVLKKNYLLQTRSRKVLFGLGGWSGLILEILIPVLFFLFMWIPKYFFKPFVFPRQVFMEHQLESVSWAASPPYTGPASSTHLAQVVFAPNTTHTSHIMSNFVKAVSCPPTPPDPQGSFYDYFAGNSGPLACRAPATCYTTPACYLEVMEKQIRGMASEADAMQYVVDNPDTVDVVIAFREVNDTSGKVDYVIRMNHTALWSNREVFSPFELSPDLVMSKSKTNWFFVNVQNALERSILGSFSASSPGPLLSSLTFKWFPWPPYVVDVAALINSVFFFNLLLVYAFLAPTRAMVVAVVREKELRLREGMKILGLKDSAYWCSWSFTHFSTLAISAVLCALVGKYPFQHSSIGTMLLLYLMLDTALIAFAYCLSTLFSKSRVAGTAAAVIYSLAMVPGYVLPSVNPYGSPSWFAACLLPPSCLSLFGVVLTKLEGSGHGVSLSTLHTSATPFFHFSVSSVLIMLALDVLIYGTLAWYLDKVMPRDIGQRLPFYFFLQPSYWCGDKDEKLDSKSGEGTALTSTTADESDVAVQCIRLSKWYRTTDGYVKRAVDHLSLEVYGGRITALLGHNGAGKTTTIAMLTGMIPPTSGDAMVNGYYITTNMSQIRDSLGICPQFDILWPDITVREHLELYAALKGRTRKQAQEEAISAADNVGLTDKLDSLAGELSGGQRRKLSVGIAFMGSPSVVFLDEPTSGMDPYSRRFTWDVIRRSREAGCAIVLTTHSMEEADMLADNIAIMAEGSLAAVGTPLQLKNKFGVGYTLSIVKKSSGSAGRLDMYRDVDAAISSLVMRHVPSAHTVAAATAELSFRLPKEDAAKFGGLLRELDARQSELSVRSYGLSVTTLEEVFLNVTSAAVESSPQAEGQPDKEEELMNEVHAISNGDSRPMPTQVLRPIQEAERMHGIGLYLMQLWALFLKRLLVARRDKVAVVTQLAVPVLLILGALTSSTLTARMVQEPAVPLTREVCLMGQPVAVGASQPMRDNSTALSALLDSYAPDPYIDTGSITIARGGLARIENLTSTIDGWLLDHWSGGHSLYDAIFVQSMAYPIQPTNAIRAVLLVNQTVIQGLSASLSSMHNALFKMVSANPEPQLLGTNLPMPPIITEVQVKATQTLGDLLLISFSTFSCCILSASFVIFLVKERESRSKEVQLVSGAPVGAFWGSTYAWDMINYCIPVAGFIVCFLWFDVPSFSGVRLTATAVLLLLVGLASLPLTYLLHFWFTDEMKAFQRINSMYFIPSYLGFIATWILDLLYAIQRWDKVHKVDMVIKAVLKVFSPHYCLARGLYEISVTYKEGTGGVNQNPFQWDVTGEVYLCLIIQAAVYFALTLMVETGVVQRSSSRAWHHIRDSMATPGNSRHGSGGYAALSSVEDPSSGQEQQDMEDDDVRAERIAVQEGAVEGQAVVMEGLRKTYPGGWRYPPVVAVEDLWLGIHEGECFGLLGVNGAGKTTTFRMLTGELYPQRGDALLCGKSIRLQRGEARQLMGYCPQYNALPGLLTGREVLRLYARIRGVRGDQREDTVSELLERLQLTQYADRVCTSYSGGTKRKLSVAVSLVGQPPVVLMDEPSTGMDPAARRFLWSAIQSGVTAMGHTVLLTSHSMEECEALCQRIAIMKSGHVRAVGTVQHLKSRYGAGYCLTIRGGLDRRDHVMSFVRQHCASATLRESDSDHISFNMPRQDVDLPGLFEDIEEQRDDLGVEEYSISQTTLDQVFVMLARDDSHPLQHP